MLIVLHAGAGQHSQKNYNKYKQLLLEITNSTKSFLLKGGSATNAVSLAISYLEDSPLTNAGIPGSNLTLDGCIEADACLMDQECFASIGSVPLSTSILTSSSESSTFIHQNPIRIVQCLLERAKKGPDEAGRQPPIFLSGPAAHAFATNHGMVGSIDGKKARDSITPGQIERYYSHMGILKESRERAQEEDELQDTVGAIVVDRAGNMAVGCSSGGISLKHPGRVGEAAIPGSGIHLATSDACKVATTLSGTGEQIMKTFLALRITDIFFHQQQDDDVMNTLKKMLEIKFLQSPRLHKDKHEKNMGAIIVRQTDEAFEFYWAHTTASFCFSYSDGSAANTHFQISRRKDGKDISIGGAFVKREINDSP